MQLFIWPGPAQELPGVDPAGDESRAGDAGVIRGFKGRAGVRDDYGVWSELNLFDEDGAAAGRESGHKKDLIGAARRARALGGRLVTWSGWIGAEEDDEREMAELRTHGRQGHERLHEAIEGAAGVVQEEGAALLLRPDARHVLSDIPSCLMFLRSRAAERVRLVLDPMGLLTESMLPRAEDHLERILSTLAEHPGVAALLMTNAEIQEADGGRRLRPVGLHRGSVGHAGSPIIDPRRLIGMISEHARGEVDWMILDEGVEEQMEMLRMYGPGV